MAESSVIREFLVQLGFKLDEPALKKFDEGITTATKSVFALATAVEATAISVAYGVARFATNLEALYFASRRTGASAQNLVAFDRAAQNLGASAGEAQGAVESLASHLRRNPTGTEGLLRSLGVQTRDAKGNLRDTVMLLTELGQQLAKRPTYMAMQYGDMFGMSEKMVLALRDGSFAADLARVRQEIGGTDWDKASRDAHQFSERLRDLEVIFKGFAVQVEDALMRKLGVSMQKLTDWLRDPRNAAKVADILMEIVRAAEKVGEAVGTAFDTLARWDKETNGWSTRIIALGAAFKFLGGFEIVGGLLSMAKSVGILTASLTALSVAAAGLGLGWLLDRIPAVKKFAEHVGETVFNAKDQVPAAIRYMRGMGWTEEQATGIVGRLLAESGLQAHGVDGDNGHAHGVAQWHDGRIADFEQWAKGAGDKDFAHSDLEEQLRFLNWEMRKGAERKAGNLMRAATTSEQAYNVMNQYYERSAEGLSQRGTDKDVAVQITQHTTIHVNGAQDPKATAKAVADAQADTNAQTARNFQPTVQ